MTTCLAAGADVQALDGINSTPLHWAARDNENPAVIEALVRAGADVQALNENARMPLVSAAGWNENPAVIEALLAVGADPMARNAQGKTPWDLAQGNEVLKGSDAYQRLNEARFESPGGSAAGSPPASRVPPAK